MLGFNLVLFLASKVHANEEREVVELIVENEVVHAIQVVLPAHDQNVAPVNMDEGHVIPRNLHRHRLFVETEGEKRARLELED